MSNPIRYIADSEGFADDREKYVLQGAFTFLAILDLILDTNLMLLDY